MESEIRTTSEEQPTAPSTPSMPDPEMLKPAGLSDRQKRWIFFGVAGVILFIILANMAGTNGPAPPKVTDRTAKAQQQNPTPAQIRDWENNLKQTEAQLQDEVNRRQQVEKAASDSPMTADDLQRATALHDAVETRNQFQESYAKQQFPSGESQKAQLEAERAQQAYKSLFADNLVRQERSQPVSFHREEKLLQQTAPAVESQARPTSALEAPTPSEQTEKVRKPLDFDPAKQEDYWLPEGTILEAVLTNRLDGEQPGPVNCMITTDVYLPGTRLLLIPQGARVLGEASKVSAFGQQRLAVAFHRIIVPGLDFYSIPLDHQTPGLAQAGETGLHDKVNSHYASIFGASLAIGAIGGLAQIGNSTTGIVYDPSVQFRNGISESMAQSADRVLDRFLNRMPTITIREGTRVKIVLTDDLQLPAYDSMHERGL
jgi:type IV secretion system protein VirB10